ncbi:MAG: hypothetical protein NTV54_04700 [Ignavibacteriales bacterium]|nr:hypothetical protein [Ignavibacteriales bacterium]
MKNVFCIILTLFFISCKKEESNPSSSAETQSPASDTVHFIHSNYIELDKIERISKFRSGIGHDYSDAFEHCRSMKHYFQPKSNVDWAAVRLFSPVRGVIVKMYDEWAGTQIHIRPFAQPTVTVIIFHVAMLKSISLGDTVNAGQQIGAHIGSQTMSDIAIGRSVSDQWQLTSYFDAMDDSVLHQYTARGIGLRGDCIISREARDADPLGCNGETFATEGILKNWVLLQ